MDGDFVVEAGSLYEFLALVLSNDRNPRPSLLADLLSRFRHLTRHMHIANTKTRTRDNASRRYDLDRRLYSLFLNEDLQYSCAYFETPDMGLGEAQMRKKQHLANPTATRSFRREVSFWSARRVRAPSGGRLDAAPSMCAELRLAAN